MPFLASSPTLENRDAWVYGPRVRELNKRINAVRKIYSHNPSSDARCYLQSVVQHVQAAKARLWVEA